MTQAPAGPPAMFSKTGAADFPSHLKVMISGPPKSGKTRFLGTVPNLIVLDTEPHANNLQSLAGLDVPFRTITSINDLKQVQFILSQEQFRKQAAQGLGLPDVEAVAIDTLDTLQAIMKKERMRDEKSSKFLRDDWGWLKEEMVSIIESFTALPMHVFFIVHTKTKDVGTETNPKTIYLPGLEGSVAESIAGMVGYSFLSFRKEETDLNAANGKRTSYFLQTEGDETYEFLGNRADGRLPHIIRPDFKTVLDTVMANKPTAQHQPVAVDLSGFQTTGQTGQTPQQPAAPAAQQPAPPAPPATQPQAQAPAPAAPPAEVPAQSAGQPEQPSGTPQNQPADTDPISPAATQYVQKVYEALEQPFPADKVAKLNMGEARNLVKTFKLIQQDAAEGKGGTQTPAEVMTQYLQGENMLADAGNAAPEQAAVEAKIDGTIDEVKAFVGPDESEGSLGRVQQAYDLEVQRTPPRSSLISWLESKGAKPAAPAPEESAQVQTPVQTDPAPSAPAESGVTPDAPVADGEVTEEQGLQNVQQGLGGVQIESSVNPEAKCEECGNAIDDEDLAELGQKRYGRLLCVKDYLAEGKKVSA